MIPLQRFMLRACALTGLVCALVSAVSAGELKVDINNNNRPLAEGLDPSFTSWNTVTSWFPANANSISATFNGVGVTFTRVGPNGTFLQPGYWKAGVQSTTFNVKLTGDGIKVQNGDAGAQIEMRIAGLSTGEHTLLLYLNNWDGPTSNAPLDIFVDGNQVANDLPVTTQVKDNNLATTAYLTFNATDGQDVVVLVKAETAGTETVKNVHINGFEIDTPNVRGLASNPLPANADEHVDADTGSVSLNWNTALNGATSHNLYLGTSLSAVKEATVSSPEFKGNSTANSYPLSGLSPHLTYYWRVDEIGAGGIVTKGVVWYFMPRRLAFPGAEGYGRFARGGRGGVVVHVTNLNDSGPGSLRDAIEGNYGARTVIFDVSGLITLQDDIIISDSRPYITVAGQTAPGKGICIKREQFGMSGARDVIFRYMRGWVGKESGLTQNATGMAGVDHCIMDHCSFGWGIDEGLSSRGGKNLTFQRCNLSEALNVAGHKNYPAGTAHGYAASIGGDIGSFHHNLLAHNEGRNWSLAGALDGAGYFAGRLDIFNNVVYNWGGRTTDGGAMEVNFVNNYYKPGAASHIFYALTMNHENLAGGMQRAYFAGNVMPGRFDETNQTAGRRSVLSNGVTINYETFVSAPFFPSYATIHTAKDAYKQVLSDVGCNLPQIDDHDTRLINETLTGTYAYVGSVSGKPGLPDTTDDVGGWEDYPETHRASDFDSDGDGLPDWWERIKGLNPYSSAGDFSEANADVDGDGYTNLEDYLNWLATPNATVEHDSFVEIDLGKLTRGYTNAPVLSVSDAVNGTVTLAADGKTAIFVPTRNIIALGSFRYTVTDAEGSTLSGVINLHIFARPPVINMTDLGGVYGSAFNLGIEATHLPTSYSATGLPPGLELDPLTGAITGTPTSAGTYSIILSATNVAGTTSITLTFTIDKAVATLTVPDQLRSYTGSPVKASATTSPAGLNVVFTYDGSADAPTYPGAYDVIATIDEPNYIGTASSEFSIAATAAVLRAPRLSGDVDGSVQLLTGDSVFLNGCSMISLDLLVPGLPTVRTFGSPSYAGTIDASGVATTGNYFVTLFGRPVLRHVVRRVDPVALPTVDVPPAPEGYHTHHSRKCGWLKPFLICPPKPVGTRHVWLNHETDTIGDFATLCHLTHNHNKPVAVPPGTYGDLSAHGRGGFILGVPGATEPAVYNLQHLTLTGAATIQLAGPVLLRVAGDVRFDGLGVSGSPDQSLTIEIARGDLSIDGRTTLIASVVAPNGRVTIGGHAILTGRVQAEELTVYGDGLLKDPEL